MATWFRARWGMINTVEVAKITSHSVWINGSRNAKRSDWNNYFETWDEVHSWLLDDLTSKVLAAQRSLDSAKDKLGNIKGMKREDAKPAEY